MKKRNLAFVDLETTGLDADRHEIIEIGAVIARQLPQPGRGNDLEIIDQFEFKVRPEHLETSDPEALRINGYNAADWLFAVDLPKALETLSAKAEGAMLVAQNVSFDALFLDKAFARTGVSNKMDFHRIDLLSMAYAKLYHDERAQRFSLRALCEHFEIKNDRAHTALADIRATVEVYKRLIA
jgi:DNA polymerase-3 subunit epsilon